ncbi:MAG: hypothetical protein N2691_05255 [Patescibacteria group bacterium]|nr:hypothetical protein [Patescibacteria group bacterium]
MNIKQIKPLSAVRSGARRVANGVKTTIRRFPIVSLVITLAFLFAAIAGANYLRRPEPEPEIVRSTPREVSVYTIGQAPRIRTQAKIEKSGVIRIVAQTGGIVQNIRFREGQTVYKGATLATISTNYSGGQVLTVQRQIAEKQYFNIRDTFDAQKDIIGKQRAIAENTEANNDKLREISEKSLEETRTLLDLNTTLLNTIDTDLAQLTATNSAGSNRNAITALLQSKAQLLSATNQLKNTIRTLEYTTDPDQPQSKLSDLSRELTLRQLEVQEKALELNKEVSHLQYSAALINESLAYPSAPCAGVIERVHVRFGQSVQPGTVLFTLSTNEKSALAVALVSQDVAANVSRIEPTLITIRGKTLSVLPSYVSGEAVDGALYAVYFSLPGEFISEYGNDSYIEAEIPVGYANTSSVVPHIPLDAVHQTQDGAYVFILEDGVAKVRKLQLGAVFGQYVEVLNGLRSKDRIILERNVINDEKVVARDL